MAGTKNTGWQLKDLELNHFQKIQKIRKNDTQWDSHYLELKRTEKGTAKDLFDVEIVRYWESSRERRFEVGIVHRDIEKAKQLTYVILGTKTLIRVMDTDIKISW